MRTDVLGSQGSTSHVVILTVRRNFRADGGIYDACRPLPNWTLGDARGSRSIRTGRAGTAQELEAFEQELVDQYALATAAAGVLDRQIAAERAVLFEFLCFLGRPREDRILNETHATGGDACRIAGLFGLSVSASTRYTATVDHRGLAPASPSC